jgi:hypothetical protein
VKPFSGLSGRATIRWQDVEVARVDVASFGKTSINVPLRSFKTPSVFTIDINFAPDEAFYRNDFESYKTNCAALSIQSIEVAEDELGQRALLITAARKMALELGLSGDYLDTAKTESLGTAILNALSDRRGFSLIRLGDGEGRALGYPNFFSDQEVLTQVLYYHFGPESMHLVKAEQPDSWIQNSMGFLKTLLEQSVRNADLIGLPVVDYFRVQSPGDRFGMLGYACAMIFGLSFCKELAPKDSIGTNVFQLAAAKGLLLKEFAVAAEQVYIVGPWDLRKQLRSALGKELHYIRVPGHYTWRGSKGFGQFPSLFRFVESQIVAQGDLSGCLFFVGAGLFGKHYCSLIKQRGGVAIDIGSVFDSWAKRGRPEAASNASINLTNL